MNANVRNFYESYPFPQYSNDYISEKSRELVSYFENVTLGVSVKKILDAGCGTGHRSIILAKIFPSAVVTGIDLSNTRSQKD